MMVKDLWRALFFVCSIQFWRMGLLWTLSVLFSHYQLLKASLFSQKLVSYPRCSPSTFPHRPVCVITGVSLSLSLAVLIIMGISFHFGVWVVFCLCRQHLASDQLLLANFPRKDMLLSLVIVCLFLILFHSTYQVFLLLFLLVMLEIFLGLEYKGKKTNSC